MSTFDNPFDAKRRLTRRHRHEAGERYLPSARLRGHVSDRGAVAFEQDRTVDLRETVGKVHDIEAGVLDVDAARDLRLANGPAD